MERYTWAEKADMHLVYGKANGCGRRAQRLYREQFPNRMIPDYRTFTSIDRQLRETGGFKVSFLSTCWVLHSFLHSSTYKRCVPPILQTNMRNTGRPRSVRTVGFEEAVLQHVDDMPATSTRSVAHRMDVAHSTVWEVLRENTHYPYRWQQVHALQPADYAARLAFAQWFVQRTDDLPRFPSFVLFTDEATFTREGCFNSHNSHTWSYENPNTLRQRGFQQQLSVNVWAGMVGNELVGPYILPPRLNGAMYRRFLESTLPDLLDDVPLDIRQDMWLQLDGAPPHYSRVTRDYLNTTFRDRWIGRGGPVAWPPRSPDLNPLDFFLWGYMKSAMYDTPIVDEEDLVARLAIVAGNVRDIPDIFERVRGSLLHRLRLCCGRGGGHIEHLL